MVKSYILLIFIFISLQFSLQAQAPKAMHAGEIQLALKKLQVLGSVLYIAAHPDDENTAMIAYLANDRLVRTAYLSLTRGDGGQNLIGAEQRELMGLIRTQELLEARKIDGGEQFFTRANDFGFSKNAKEAKAIWGEKDILADVVWTIRNYKPDVIITRFPPNRGAGHGHHEASSMLAIEAFKAAADPKKFPEQLKYTKTWQTKRIVWNCYSRRFGRFTSLPPDSLAHLATKVEIGSYNPLLGKSHLVVAAESRSMHKSQGFGASKPRGERDDYLLHFDGVQAKEDIFEDFDLTWNRLGGNGNKIGEVLAKAYQNFNPEKPNLILPNLLEAQKLIEEDLKSRGDDNNYWLKAKEKELKKVIQNCMTLWLEANAKTYAVSAGDSLEVKIEAVSRSQEKIILEKVEFMSDFDKKVIGKVDSLPLSLEFNKLFNPSLKIKIPENMPISQPYWLTQKPEKGIFKVDNSLLIGKPENDPVLWVKFHIKIQSQSLVYERPITYKWRKPDEGELYRHLEITPKVMLSLQDKVVIFTDTKAKKIKLTVKAGSENLKGKAKLNLPENWTVEPRNQSFELKEREEEQTLIFTVTPPKSAEKVKLTASVKLDKQSDFEKTKGIIRIDYPHIPIQTLFPDTEAELINLDIKTTSKNIGYIEGAGDDIPQALTQIGLNVTMLDEEKLKEDLSKYDCIIAGVRAYNTQERLKFYHKKLLKYVENGGVYIVQYHTPWRMVVKQLGPHAFKLDRGSRVTVEEAPIKFLKPEHPILNYPNKITQKDFEGWVQERGLYFAKEWNDKYETVLSTNDPNEEALAGGLLYTKYGKGKFIYTGYSFFRELPAGVVGAYRLFVNLMSK